MILQSDKACAGCSECDRGAVDCAGSLRDGEGGADGGVVGEGRRRAGVEDAGREKACFQTNGGGTLQSASNESAFMSTVTFRSSNSSTVFSTVN